MKEEIRDLLGRISTLDASLASMTNQVMAASKAMGDAVRFASKKIKKDQGSPSSPSASDEAVIEATEKLTERLSSLAPDIREQIEQNKEVVKSIKDLTTQMEEDRKKRSESESKTFTGEQKFAKVVEDLNSSIKQLSKKLSGPGERLNMVVGDNSAASSGGGGGGRGGSGGGGSPPGGQEDPERLGREAATALGMGLRNETREQISGWLTGISTVLMGGKGDFFQTLFSGSVRDITQFREEARLLAYELEGVSENTRRMQADFADMGDVARQTGKSMDVMQRVFMSNMRKGFKGQGVELKKVLKSGLHLSTMIGSDSGATADIFSDWNRMLGMSVDQMSQLATDAKDVARSTGVTGDELLQAMKSSEGILKNLRNQGNLTSTAGKNVIEAMTMAKKLGVEDKMSGVLDMMTSTNKFLDGDALTRNFVSRMAQGAPGGVQSVMDGTIMNDPAALKGFANEMNRVVDQFTGGRAKTVEDMEKLGAKERSDLSVLLSKHFGLEIYEFKSVFESLQEQTKSLGDRFAALDKEAGNANESLESQNLARTKATELMMDSSMGFVNKFAEQMRKEGKNFNDAMSQVNSSFNDTERKNMQELFKRSEGDVSGVKGLGESEELVKSLLVASKAMNKRGDELEMNIKDFGPEILAAAEKARAGGSSGELIAIIGEMQEVGKEIGVKSKKNVTPMETLAQKITELNETLRKFVSGPIGILVDVLGWVGLALLGVTASVGGLFLGLPQQISKMISGFASFKNTVKELNVGGKIGKYMPLKGFNPALIMAGVTEGIAWSFGKMADSIDQVLNFKFAKMIKRFRNALNLVGNMIGIGLPKAIGLALNSIFSFASTAQKSLLSMFALMIKGFRNALNLVGNMIGIGLPKAIGLALNSIFSFASTARKSLLSMFALRSALGGVISAIMSFVKSKSPLKMLSMSFRGLGRGFKAIGAGLKRVPVIGWLLMAVDGVIGAVEGYKKAGDIFGVKTEQITKGMRISASAAGGVVGVLDGLTFGLLRATGVAGPLTEILSKLIYGFIWFGEGIKQGFLSVMPAIKESMKSLGEALGGLWTEIAGIFGYDAMGTGNWESFYQFMKDFGYLLGVTLGATLKVTINAVSLLIKGFKYIAWGIKVVVKAVKSLVKGIVGGFQWLYDKLWGHSIVPDLCEGITYAFAMMASKVLVGLMSFVANVVKLLASIPSKVVAGLSSLFMSLVGVFDDFLIKPASALLRRLGLAAAKGGAAAASAAATTGRAAATGTAELAASGSGALAKEGSKSLLAKGAKEESKILLARGAGMLAKGAKFVVPGIGGLIDFSIRKAMGQDTMQAAAGAIASEIGATIGILGGPWGRIAGGVMGGMIADYFMYPTPTEEKGLKSLKAIQKANETLTKEATTKNSIYTHDKHVEDILKKPGYKGSNDPASDQTMDKVPEAMWTAQERITDDMRKQREALNSTKNFEESAQRASVEGLKERGVENIEYDGGKISIESAMEKGTAQIEERARSRFLEDNKEAVAAMDANINELRKKVLDESNLRANKGKGVRDMPSYKALQEARAEKDRKFGQTPERYYKEDTMGAAMPGEDPNLLYESRKEAMMRAGGKAEKEREFIKSEKQELEGLKARRKEVRSRRDWFSWAAGIDPDKNELDDIDRKIAEIEGSKTSTTMTPGSIEKAESRLKNWEREAADPSSRRVIGKNMWTGDSDTSVVFPGERTGEAIDRAYTGEQVTIEPKVSDIPDAGPPMSPAAQRNMEAIEKFGSGADASASEAVLEQNVEQTKKLGTMEESAARSLEPGSIYTHDIHLEKLLGGMMGDDRLLKAANVAGETIEARSSYHSTPVGHHAVPMMREEGEGVSDVQPVHLRDIAESILKDKVGGEAGTGKLQSDELTRLEEVANRQYEEMQQINEGIREMVSILRPSSEPVGSGTDQRSRTSFARKHVSPSIFGQIKDGKPGSGPNRSAYKN